MATSSWPEQRVDGAIEVGRLAAQEVDALGRRRGAAEHRQLDLLDVALEPLDGVASV